MSVTVTLNGVDFEIPSNGDRVWGTDVTAFLSAIPDAIDDAVAGAGGGAAVSSATPQPVGSATAGVSADASRDDHVHAHGNQAGGTLHSNAVAGGAAGFMSGTDKTKLDSVASSAAALTASTPAAVGTAAVGVGTTAARSDHVHAHGDQLGGTLHAVAGASAGFMSAADKTKLDGVATSAAALTASTPADVGTAAVGVGTSAARSDHVHGHGNLAGGSFHAVAVAAGAAGFMSGADKTKLDGIATGATAEVDTDITHSGRVNLSRQTLGDLQKTVAGLSISGSDFASRPLTVINSTSNASPAEIKNTSASGYSLLAFQDTAGTDKGFVGFANSTVAKTALRSKMILEAADVDLIITRNVATTSTVSATMTNSTGDWTFAAAATVTGAFTGSTTITADSTTAAQNGQIHAKNSQSDAFAAFRAYDSSGAAKISMGYANSGTAAPFTTSAYMSIASGSTFKFFTASTLNMTVSTGGVWNFVSTPQANSVDILSQTNTISGITNKTFSSMTHGGTLALGSSTVTGSWSFSGSPTIGGTVTLSGAVTLSSATAASLSGGATFGAANTYKGATGITAFATGGQASATALTAEINFVTTVASAADSVKLPTAALGSSITIFNLGANSMNIYPVSGSAIDALGTNAAYALAAGGSKRFCGQSTTQWRST